MINIFKVFQVVQESISLITMVVFFLGISLLLSSLGRYVPWLAIARPSVPKLRDSGLPPYGRHHYTALMQVVFSKYLSRFHIQSSIKKDYYGAFIQSAYYSGVPTLSSP